MDEKTQKLTIINSDVQTVEDKFKKIVVTNDDEKVNAVEFLGDIKNRMKRIDLLRKQFVQPLNDHVKTINNEFRMPLDKLKKIENELKKGLKDYVDEQERKARKEFERQKKEAEESGETKEIEVAQPEAQTRASTGLMSTKKVWKFDIVDPEKVPKKYWIIDESAIRKDILQGGERKIDGVKIYQDTQISMR